MNNKVIHTMNLSKELHALAIAWTQSQDNFNGVMKKVEKDFPDPKNCPVEIKASLTALGVLQESLQSQFWDAVNDILPEKYSGNKQQCNPVKGRIQVLDEKVPDKCEECEESEDNSTSLEDIMEQAGVQNADEWGRA